MYVCLLCMYVMCLYVCIYVCMHVLCMSVMCMCVCVCMCACMYVCMYVFIEHKIVFLYFVQSRQKKFLLPRRMQRDIMTTVHRCSCTVSVILAIFQ
jgi:hypothetical protein